METIFIVKGIPSTFAVQGISFEILVSPGDNADNDKIRFSITTQSESLKIQSFPQETFISQEGKKIRMWKVSIFDSEEGEGEDYEETFLFSFQISWEV